MTQTTAMGHHHAVAAHIHIGTRGATPNHHHHPRRQQPPHARSAEAHTAASATTSTNHHLHHCAATPPITAEMADHGPSCQQSPSPRCPPDVAETGTPPPTPPTKPLRQIERIWAEPRPRVASRAGAPPPLRFTRTRRRRAASDR
ncbi:protein spaetzle 3, partial [Triticum aestivum]|uniref:protein spaetzle 3 n=1 Tax=Triticum aestivum TaxID=4565 RepID=UPI001D010BB3